MILPRIIPRSIVLRSEPDFALHIGQFSVVEHVSIAFWLTVKTISKDEARGTALKLCSVCSAWRQVLKQSHVVVLAKHSSMKRLGIGPSRGSHGVVLEK
jgi:hypothetical protein